MIQKNHLTLLLTASLVLFAASSFAVGQSAPVRGLVKLQKSDGTVVPVVGAIVEAFRTDIDRGKMPESKTNKKGEFSFVGFPLGQRYALAVSGPGISPQVEVDVKGGMESIVLTVREGDGRRLTEAEARQVAKGAIGSPTGELTAEEKRQQAENAKKIAEVEASNQKAEGANKIINAAVKAGADAFNAKNYDLAIIEYDKGIEAAPDFVGSAPTFLGNKGLALQKRAVGAYNESLKGDAAARAAALEKNKADLASAFAAFDRGFELLKSSAAASDTTTPQRRLTLLTYALETHGVAAKIAHDPARLPAANAILEEYLTAETDQAKRNANLLTFANGMNAAGELKPAAAAYRKVLETAPDNLDAIAGLGLSLYSIGYDPPDKATLQDGLNYMQKFVDAAPDTHPLKQSVKETIEELKNTQKLAPQKVTPPRRKG